MLPTTQSSTSTDWPVEAMPKKWIEKLFEAMSYTYGKKFSDQWGGVDSDGLKRHWASKLADFTGPEIKRGVDALEGREWPPTLPEFKLLCRPAINPTVAYYHALEQGQRRANGEKGDWPNPAIYWAWVRIGAYDFNNVGYTALKPRWEKALADEAAKGEWSEIPDAHLAIPAPGKNETSREEAKQQLEKLGASGILKRPEVGGRQWAHRLLERAKTDPSVPHAAIKIAQEAIAA